MPAVASSHREAPFIAASRSSTPPISTCSGATSPGARAYVTIVANYLPLQDPYGGPNYFKLGSPNGGLSRFTVNMTAAGAVENTHVPVQVPDDH
jgi:hypothetical protein